MYTHAVLPGSAQKCIHKTSMLASLAGDAFCERTGTSISHYGSLCDDKSGYHIYSQFPIAWKGMTLIFSPCWMFVLENEFALTS